MQLNQRQRTHAQLIETRRWPCTHIHSRRGTCRCQLLRTIPAARVLPVSTARSDTRTNLHVLRVATVLTSEADTGQSWKQSIRWNDRKHCVPFTASWQITQRVDNLRQRVHAPDSLTSRRHS